MSTKNKATTLAASAAGLFLLGALLTTDLISMPTTHELAFGFLVTGVLGGLAISEFRQGAPRPVAGFGPRRFLRQHFRA